MDWCRGGGRGGDISHNAAAPPDPGRPSGLCEPECWRHIAVMGGAAGEMEDAERAPPAPLRGPEEPEEPAPALHS